MYNKNLFCWCANIVKVTAVQDGAFKKFFTPFYESLVNIGYSKLWGVAGSVTDKWIFGVNKANFYISPPKDLNYTLGTHLML